MGCLLRVGFSGGFHGSVPCRTFNQAASGVILLTLPQLHAPSYLVFLRIGLREPWTVQWPSQDLSTLSGKEHGDKASAEQAVCRAHARVRPPASVQEAHVRAGNARPPHSYTVIFSTELFVGPQQLTRARPKSLLCMHVAYVAAPQRLAKVSAVTGTPSWRTA